MKNTPISSGSMKIRLFTALLPLATSVLQAQTIRTWTGATSAAWTTETNWSPNTNFAGEATAAVLATEGAATDIMTTAAANTAGNIGINMNTLTAAGGVGLSLGAIHLDRTSATNLQIGNSSTTVNGILQLNGATVNSVPNTLVRVGGLANLIIANVNTGTGTQTMGVRLGITNGIVDADINRYVAISSNITEAAANSSITKTGPGALSLGGTNSFTGGTTTNGGTLAFRTVLAKTTGTHTFNAGTVLGLGIGTGGFTATDVQNAFASNFTGNLASISIGSSNNISIDTTGAAATLSANIGPSTRGLEKIPGGQNLTLTGANQYSGRTVVNAGSAIVVNSLGNIGDTSSNVGTNSTIDMMRMGRIDIVTGSSSNKNFNILGTLTEPSVIFGNNAGAVTLSGSISTETAGVKLVQIGNNAALTMAHTISGTFSDGAGTLNLRKINPGRWILSGANTHTGATSITGGILELTNSLALQNSAFDTTISVAGTSTVGLRTTVTSLTLGGLTGNKNFAGIFTTTTGGYSAVTSLTLNPPVGTAPSYAAVIANGAAGMNVNKTGAGTQILTGVNTYTGGTNISAGTLAVETPGSINTSSGVSLTGGTLRYNSTTNLSSPVTFTSGVVTGTNWNGSLSGLTIGTNRTISPGNSPGIATTNTQTWADSGTYLWEMNNATGSPGAGWDLVNGTGALDITASSASPFGLSIISLTLANVAGNAANFDDTIPGQWLLADFASISGFSVDKFSINTTGFTNPVSGSFSVALGDTVSGGDNTQLYLVYSPIPEPTALALFGLGGLALLRRRRC